MPYGMIGAIMAFTSRAIFRAKATGAVMSAPLLITPCGSRVPVGSITVLIFDGTYSLNSIQLISVISRVLIESGVCPAATLASIQIAQRTNKSEIRRICFLLGECPATQWVESLLQNPGKLRIAFDRKVSRQRESIARTLCADATIVDCSANHRFCERRSRSAKSKYRLC